MLSHQEQKLSVLHCHGVFSSVSCHLNRRSSRSRSSSSRRRKKLLIWTEGAAGAEAAAAGGGKSWSSRSRNSSSRRKKWLKSSFSMGFRSCIRHFLGAILILFRPSLPWCFPIQELPFEQKEQHFSVLHCHGVFPSGSCHLNRRSSRSRSSSRRKKLLKSFFSLNFRCYIRHLCGATLAL